MELNVFHDDSNSYVLFLTCLTAGSLDIPSITKSSFSPPNLTLFPRGPNFFFSDLKFLLDQNIFGSKHFFGTQIFFRTKKYFSDQKFFLTKNFLGTKKLSTQKNFLTKNFFWPNFFSDQNFFGPKFLYFLLDQKIFWP